MNLRRQAKAPARADSNRPAPLPAGLHPAVWLAWASSVMVVAWTTTNPFYLGILLLCIVLVAVLAPRTRTGAAGLKIVAIFGTLMLGISIAIATINGASGDHEIFTIPGPEIPSWLGGLRLGGPVTVEALVGATSRGLAIFAVFLAFAVFNSAVAPSRMLRLTPAALFHASIVVTIGLSLLPATIEDVRRIREMRALRGANAGLRDLPAIVVPAVIGGLERSMRLAEAMEARGFSAGQPAAAWQRVLLLVPAPCALAATWLWFYATDFRWLAGLLALVAAGSVWLWLRAAAQASPRTRFRDEPWTRFDRVTLATATISGAGAFVASQAEAFGLGYNPWAGLPVPELHPGGLALVLLSAWPAIASLGPSPSRASTPLIAEGAQR